MGPKASGSSVRALERQGAKGRKHDRQRYEGILKTTSSELSAHLGPVPPLFCPVLTTQTFPTFPMAFSQDTVTHKKAAQCIPMLGRVSDVAEWKSPVPGETIWKAKAW